MHGLVIFDMDGTLFESKNLWLDLHKELGTLDEGKRATEKLFYNDYEQLIDVVIHNLWKGKPAQPFLDLIASAEYLPGVEEGMKELKRKGYLLAIISSGPDLLVERAKRELGIEYGFGNHLELKEGLISGRSRYDDGKTMFPVGGKKKVPIAEELCAELGYTMKEVTAVGDGQSDIELFRRAGRSIAFNNPHKELKRIATHVVEGNDLRRILEYL